MRLLQHCLKRVVKPSTINRPRMSEQSLLMSGIGTFGRRDQAVAASCIAAGNNHTTHVLRGVECHDMGTLQGVT